MSRKEYSWFIILIRDWFCKSCWGEFVLIEKILCFDQSYTKSLLLTYFTFSSEYICIIEVCFIIFGVIKLSLWKGCFSITFLYYIIKHLISLLRELKKEISYHIKRAKNNKTTVCYRNKLGYIRQIEELRKKPWNISALFEHQKIFCLKSPSCQQTCHSKISF